MNKAKLSRKRWPAERGEKILARYAEFGRRGIPPPKMSRTKELEMLEDAKGGRPFFLRGPKQRQRWGNGFVHAADGSSSPKEIPAELSGPIKQMEAIPSRSKLTFSPGNSGSRRETVVTP